MAPWSAGRRAAMLKNKIRILNAGAGSGKTYRLTQELLALLKTGSTIRPEGIIATTFTRKASAELMERLRQALFDAVQHNDAEQLSAGFIGTVNGVCGALLQHLAFEAGISPATEVIPEEDQQALFTQAFSEVISGNQVDLLEEIAGRFDNLEWQDSLKKIVDAARGNNCRAADFADFAKKSVEALMQYLPPPDSTPARDLDDNLRNAVSRAINDIRNNTADPTKTTRDYLAMLEAIEVRLKQQVSLPWADWVRLTAKEPGKKSAALAQPVQRAAALHASHPLFHEDLRNFISKIFELAGEVLAHYQSYKKERGLMDFVDQESLLLEVLESAEVRARLAEELDLLMVDEFQDTSPIQLALFLKLAGIVKQTIWVGDPKQSVYAFRGADPSLMAAVVKAVPVRPGDILNSSYRSRADLVNFVNTLFVPAFSGMLPAEQVELKSTRKDPPGAGTALRTWVLSESSKEKRLEEMASGVVSLIREAPIVFDPAVKQDRRARAGDIAILCRSNEECSLAAQALIRRGIRVALGKPGLLRTPEGRLLLACIRYFLNDRDTLAKAEIQVLTSVDPRPEDWLRDRISWVTAKKDSHQWAENHDVLSTLRGLSSRAVDFSPSEALDEIIEAIDMRRLFVGWGERDRRLGNLENLRMLSRTYEESCGQQMIGASLGGLLLWLDSIAPGKEGTQVEGRGEDAVTIMTCHGAKGLEWPIVVVARLDTSPRENIWELTVIDERTTPDLQEPLAGRWLRYWPWPYNNKQKNGLELLDNIKNSDLQNKAASDAEAEELRLLYVTLTRARDYLVLCCKPKNNHWLDLAAGKAGLDLDTSGTGGENILQPGTDGTTLPMLTFSPGPLDMTPKPPEPDLIWVSERPGKKVFPPAVLNPHSIDLQPGISVTVETPLVIGKKLAVLGKPSADFLGHALHGFIAADLKAARTRPERVSMLEGLLSRYEVSGALTIDEVLDNCDAFYTFLAGLKPSRILPEWPVHMKTGDQVVVGTADLLIETPAGWVVVDHKSFSGHQGEWPKVAESYAGQLNAYAEALPLATGKPVLGTYIHFILGGAVIEIKVK